MRGNRSTDTKPEFKLRRALWARGIKGYRKNVGTLPGKPDIVFKKAHLVIQVPGCFWHCCPVCFDNRWRLPKTNTEYWSAKLNRNVERDAQNTQRLEELGYRVLVIWEHEIKSDLPGVVQRIFEALESQQESVQLT